MNVMKTSNWFTFGLALAVPLLLAAGCSPEQVSVQEPACQPARIVLMVDQTDSKNRTRTPDLSREEIASVLTMLQLCGGELAVGVIRDQSNRSLVRLRVDTAPVRPVVSNPFEAVGLEAEWKTRVEERQARVESDVQTFFQDLQSVLELPTVVTCTDILGALQRVRLFIEERDAEWQSPANWAVFISDGLHNCTQTVEIPFPRDTRLLVVNGSASLGILETLSPERFESARSALDYLVKTQRRNPAQIVEQARR